MVVHLWFFTLLEMAPLVLDHLWTQDSSMFPLSYEYTLGPYIFQGRPANTVWLLRNKQNPNREGTKLQRGALSKRV